MLITFALLAVAAGCSRMDFPTTFGLPPGGRHGPAGKGGGSTTAADARSEQLAEVLSKWNQQLGPIGADQEYQVGPGDELDVGIFALEKPEETTHLKRTVTKDGVLPLPWVGDLPAAGVTVRQLENRVRAAYSGRFIKNPQVTVEVAEHRSAAIVVTGAVKNPGIYYLTSSKSTVLEMLLKAGGLAREAADEVLVIRPPKEGLPESARTNAAAMAAGDAVESTLIGQGGSTISIDLRRLIDGSDLGVNAVLGAGDVVAVRSLAQRFIYILGYVARPGAYEMATPQLDPVRAVALAGGLTPISRPDNCFILRETQQGQSVIPVNLVKMAHGVRAPTYLEGGDTLVIGTSLMGRLSEFVRPSAAFGVNASYSPLP
ncbi:MAG: polysaccharide biosynthesis/export family protein [Verrucomicrobiota bacterium]